MLLLVSVNIARGVGLQAPGGNPPVRPAQPAAGKRTSDQGPDPVFVGRLGGEQDPNFEALADRRNRRVVRRQRTRRLMVPVPAQRNGYRATERAGVCPGLDRHNGVMSVGFARHGY